jgi:uncharacterized protein (TIGR03792 family)
VVVEYLTFVVDPADRAEWLEVEEATWSRFLERQPGYVGKQVWAERGLVDHVHAIIWWESEELWQAIPADELEAVDRAMGRWYRECSCRVFEVLRDR